MEWMCQDDRVPVIGSLRSLLKRYYVHNNSEIACPLAIYIDEAMCTNQFLLFLVPPSLTMLTAMFYIATILLLVSVATCSQFCEWNTAKSCIEYLHGISVNISYPLSVPLPDGMTVLNVNHPRHTLSATYPRCEVFKLRVGFKVPWSVLYGF